MVHSNREPEFERPCKRHLVPAQPGVAEELAATEPDRCFRPQPSASGVFATWLGVDVDPGGADGIDWSEIAAVLEDAYRTVAPRRLIAELET